MRERSIVPSVFPARGLAVAVVAAFALAMSSCGGDDDCSGFVSINAPPERCMELAEEFGCESFEVDGPSCGLVACARCEGD
ncbi:MAG: hypothetical protein FJ144_10215 [Deltaproteobacteria bacterium]|nr:hypothetical protein [Deltaproteobacteria bacterium]